MNEIKFDGETVPQEQLPIPCGWQILLAPIKIEEKTSGGIILTKSDSTSLETIRFISKVIAMGPLAYTGDKYRAHPNGPATPWCKVGDIISTGQYAGSQIPCRTDELGDFYFRMVADDEIKSVIPALEIINA